MKTALKICLTIYLILFTYASCYAQWGTPGSPFPAGDHPVVVNGSVDRDMYSQLVLAPSVVEIKQPTTVSITTLNPDGSAKANRNVQLYVSGVSIGVSITQPPVTNSLGQTVGYVNSSVPGSYLVCAKDLTDGIEILILDCESVYVTPVPVPTMFAEPLHTKGESNVVLWDMVGSLSYQFFSQSSKLSSFAMINSDSGWITSKGYNFQNLEDTQIYFYRVKAKNIYGGESSWSNTVFSVQDSSGPEISVVDISSVGDSNTEVWSDDFEITFKYRIKDNIQVASKEFWCVDRGGGRDNCNYVHTLNNDIWSVTIKLEELLVTSQNTLYTDYEFCVEALDSVGNVSRNCNAKLYIPVPTIPTPKPPVKEPTKIVEVIKEIGKVIEDIWDNSVGSLDPEQIERSVVTTTVVNVAFGFTFLLSNITSLPYLVLQIILSLSVLLGFRKGGKLSGYVYDSISKEPVAQAIIRVYNENKGLVWTDVTNSNGFFSSTELGDGEFSIVVTAKGYSFPSKIVFGKKDFPLERVYHGEDFLTRDGHVPQFSIPLDKKDISNSRKFVERLLFHSRGVWRVIHFVFFVIGLVLSVYAVVNNLVWWAYIVLLLYIPSLFLFVWSLVNRGGKYGVVVDEDGHLMGGVIVGLREDEFDKLVSKRVTDHRGRYRFIVEKGSYSLVVLNPDLVLEDERGFKGIVVKKRGGVVLAPKLRVVKSDVNDGVEDLNVGLKDL